MEGLSRDGSGLANIIAEEVKSRKKEEWIFHIEVPEAGTPLGGLEGNSGFLR